MFKEVQGGSGMFKAVTECPRLSETAIDCPRLF